MPPAASSPMMPQYFSDSYAGPAAYPPLMSAYTMESTPGASSSGAQRYLKTEGPQSPGRAPQPVSSTSGAPAASPVLAASTTSRHRVSGDGPQAQHSSGKSSLSAITAPYHPDPAPPAPAPPSLPSGMPAPPAQPPAQPKNCPAQTLIPGERLRPTAEEGPASSTEAAAAAAVLQVAAWVVAAAGAGARGTSTTRRRGARAQAGAVVARGAIEAGPGSGAACTGGRRAATMSASAWARSTARAGASA
ncbi:hypothetical protein HYPSUDRAFT_1044958 [Hypholoma sublateritium FD-334 SS-4]|uniref:Uncharacterized protein n=1 Tax=Hypholoma sublateritium (strain FD-334 SS-4) TaxID=945553 RepID=A0A0D2P9J1_HYPSF|nr:hypothetical protein HYPSUDRAFT_1044958 [Hypholoma sublateritium FD-334 SS-4]